MDDRLAGVCRWSGTTLETLGPSFGKVSTSWQIARFP